MTEIISKGATYLLFIDGDDWEMINSGNLYAGIDMKCSGLFLSSIF